MYICNHNLIEMSQIQQLLTAVNNLTERLSQIESNSKRIFELPQNITPNGLSKFAISRPEGIGETTEYMTLNKILEWCIEEMQNIENSTILVQMLPPELLSSPRRIKIPTLSDETEVPIVWKILGVQYSENEEQEFEIPDADEDNYRKDLILGTQNGDIIRFQGVESDEGVIEPVQPENTVLLTSMVVFGDSVYQEPTEPIVGDMYVKKAGFTSFMYTGNPGSQVFKGITETSKNLFIHPLSPGQGFFSGYIKTSNSNVYDSMLLQVENRRATSVMMRNKSTSTPPPGSQFTYIKFDFRNDELENYELKPGEVLTFVIIGEFAVLVCSNMPVGSGGPTSADQVSYDNTASGLLAETVQEAIDELAGHVTELYETKEDRVSVIPISANTTISALHHGKILLVTADVTITFPTGLGAGFTGCAFRIATGGKMTPAFASGVTGNDFFADYNPGESLYVFKESNSTNVFYAV